MKNVTQIHIPVSEINECDSNSCVNGTCEDRDNQYICVCNSEWTGVNCADYKGASELHHNK